MDLFTKRNTGEISSFLTGMAFPHPFVRRNDISTAQGKNYWQGHNFFPKKDVEMPHLFAEC